MARLPYKEVAQMRKFLALAALLALSVAPAHAASPTQRWLPAQLTWRHTQVPALPDSDVVSYPSASQTRYDTTTAFPLVRCEVPDNGLLGRNGAAIDTTVWFTFNWYPSPSAATTPTADSMLVQAQVSMDGSRWVTATPNRVYDATRTTGNDGGAIIVANATSLGASAVFKQNLQIANAGPQQVYAATAPTDQQMFGWQFIRFIVQPCGALGQYRAFLTRWSSEGTNGVISQ